MSQVNPIMIWISTLKIACRFGIAIHQKFHRGNIKRFKWIIFPHFFFHLSSFYSFGTRKRGKNSREYLHRNRSLDVRKDGLLLNLFSSEQKRVKLAPLLFQSKWLYSASEVNMRSWLNRIVPFLFSLSAGRYRLYSRKFTKGRKERERESTSSFAKG